MPPDRTSTASSACAPSGSIARRLTAASRYFPISRRRARWPNASAPPLCADDRTVRGTKGRLMAQHHNALGQPSGTPLRGWSPRPRPPRTAMAGRFCTVAPLDPERDAAQLFAAYADDRDGRMWTYLPRGPYASRAEYRAWADAACRADDPLVHTIIDNTSGEAVGTAAYMRIEPEGGGVEIGSITWSPRLP